MFQNNNLEPFNQINLKKISQKTMNYSWNKIVPLLGYL